MNVAAVILAAGQGTRMVSGLPKVLHTINDRAMISILLDTVSKISIQKSVVVTGFQANKVEQEVGKRAVCVFQEEQLGTGHAVLQAESALRGFSGYILILCGDAPLFRAKTLESLLWAVEEDSLDGAVFSMKLDHPFGYGRIVKNIQGLVEYIVEEKSASDKEKAITEVNSGVFCFRAEALWSSLHEINCQNTAGEYYLTDVVKILSRKGCPVMAKTMNDAREAMGVNSPEDLAQARLVYRELYVG